jgi:hypothetical protein
MIELGDRVKDKITGLKGLVIGMTKWLYGCDRIVIQPEEAKDGKPADSFNIDVGQAELIKKKVIEPVTMAPTVSKPGGPQNDSIANRRSNAAR